MKLTGQEKEQLQQALIDAFNYQSLKQMLAFKLDKDLDTITTANGFSNIVFDLITIANQEGWISQLITFAREYVPDNQLLATTSAILLAKLQQETTNNSTASQANSTKNIANQIHDPLRPIREKRKQELIEDIASAYKQLGVTLSEVDKTRIQRHIDNLEQELQSVENKLLTN